jgi:hypothetical protein
VGIWLLGWLAGRRGQPQPANWSRRDRWPQFRFYLLLALLALVMVGAGYAPIVAGWYPNLANVRSRVNLFPSIGSAAFVAACLMLGSLLAARAQSQVKTLFLASAIPFVLLAGFTQASVDYAARTAWQEQKAIWQQLFTLAPDFRDGTVVVFVLPGYQDRAPFESWRRLPLDAPWEVTAAIHVLYDNPTLSADVFYPDVLATHSVTLGTAGVVLETGEVVPYSRAVFYAYDGPANRLSRLESLPADWVGGAEGPVTVSGERVVAGKAPVVPLRRLVQD